MKHLSKKEMQPFKGVIDEQQELAEDWHRRRRNAIKALVDLDPRALAWLERWVNPHLNVKRQALLIEWRARALLLPRYTIAFGPCNGKSIFGDRPFTDRGNLSPG